MKEKRAFDLVLGVPIALVSLPVMAVVGIAIALVDGPPVLLRQGRVGAHERTFTMFKFRTMARGVPTVAKSLIGPRPALPSQLDLLELRRRKGIDVLAPGMTGLAQVKGREALTLSTKTRFEALYLRRRSIGLDALILVWTVRALFVSRGTY